MNSIDWALEWDQDSNYIIEAKMTPSDSPQWYQTLKHISKKDIENLAALLNRNIK